MKILWNPKRWITPPPKFNLKIKLTTLLLFTAIIGLHANNSYSQKTKITLDRENASVLSIIDDIESTTDFKFVYNTKFVDVDRKVTLKVKRESILTVLELLFKDTSTSFAVEDKQVILTKRELSRKIAPKKESTFQDPIRITGTVSEENDIPLAGATVVLKGTAEGVSTDLDGNFEIVVPDEQSVLEISYIGYETQEVTVGNRTAIKVVLRESLSQLENVVVVGYGTQQKVKLTSSIAQVKDTDIQNIPSVGIDQALQGQAAGLFINSSSGAPGAPPLIRIRGQNSINSGNQPFVVVDGIPVLTGNPEFLDSGRSLNFNALSSINPADIQSIEVLKDAAATAIYGSRGSNGVLLITTKRGRIGKTNIRVNLFSGLSAPVEVPDLLNSSEFVEIKSEAFINDGLQVPEILLNADTSINTDWVDEITRTALMHNIQISADGGNDKFSYFVSGSFRDEEATIINSDFQRITLRSNLDFKVGERLNLQSNIFLGRENQRAYEFVEGGNTRGFEAGLFSIPFNPVRDENGKFVPGINLFGFLPVNPVRDLVVPDRDATSAKVITNLVVDYKILPYLNFKANTSFDYNQLINKTFFPSSTSQGFFLNGIASEVNSTTETYNLEPMLEFKKSFSSHTFNLIAGSTFFGVNNSQIQVSGRGISRDDLTIINAAENVFANETASEYKYSSVFGRLNYDYDGKYLFGGSFRRDGSSSFGVDNRFGNFWALSGGWVLTGEEFLNEVEAIDLVKIRASYGVTGNDQIGDFASLSRFGVNNGYNNLPGLQETQLANESLTWEETTSLNIGLDLSFLNSLLTITADYFKNAVNDLLLSVPLSAPAGFNTIFQNVGKTENKGWELSFNSMNIQNDNFSWSTSFNITSVRNEIMSLVNDEPILSSFDAQIVGESINSFYGMDFLGVDPQTGDVQYRDVDGDGEINRELDRTIIGNPLPRWFGGLTNSFSYKNLSLDVFFQFVKDVDLYDSSINAGILNGGVDLENQSTAILNRWQQPGDITDIPRVTTFAGVGNNNRFSSRFLWDASYIRLKNVTLSYNLPRDLLNTLNIQNLRFYVTGANLLTFTDYPFGDPEVTTPGGGDTGRASGNLPQSRSVLCGLDINF